MFIDKIRMKLSAGSGGNGAVSWRREKYIAKGGPTGGNGGKGGSVILLADDQTYSLDAYRNRRLLGADNGVAGGQNRRSGKNGQDLTLKVPCGTLVRNREGEVTHDLTEPGQTLVLCTGGLGGRGNASFASPTNRAPNKSTPGKEGDVASVELELKLIADVGLVGFPNAGKSTTIRTLSKAPVKVAPYPFTTLQPNLGMIQFDDYSRVLIADIPGIIEGASENRGLGLEFLRHIERTKVLVFMLDASGIDGRNPIDDFHVLKQEIAAYSEEMLQRPFVVALNKVDEECAAEHVAAFHAAGLAKDVYEISALDGLGMDRFLEAVREMAQREGKRFI
jgi:GTP-binding protein